MWEAGFGSLYWMEGVVVRLQDRRGGGGQILNTLRVNNDNFCDLAALALLDDRCKLCLPLHTATCPPSIPSYSSGSKPVAVGVPQAAIGIWCCVRRLIVTFVVVGWPTMWDMTSCRRPQEAGRLAQRVPALQKRPRPGDRPPSDHLRQCYGPVSAAYLTCGMAILTQLTWSHDNRL